VGKREGGEEGMWESGNVGKRACGQEGRRRKVLLDETSRLNATDSRHPYIQQDQVNRFLGQLRQQGIRA
jgi:hypothetical protein